MLKSELLLPVGSLEKLKVAVLYGADAVYMGTPDLSLRAKSQMSLAQVEEGISFAHSRGKKVYLTLNLFSHNSDIEKLAHYVNTIKALKPDGVIIADVGVFQYVKTHAPELELHISTQANVCSWLSVQFWQDIGAKLIVLAREVSFVELQEIREKCPDIKLEAFVHGSMCMTYSGRCLLSNYMAERGANQGACANSCRWKYKVHMKLKDGTLKEIELNDDTKELFEFFLEEEERMGELLPLEEDERGSYILNAKDLCIMPKLDEYLKIGVDSLKIEGRNRSAYYVAITARAYRMAMDDWARDPENWSPEPYMKELNTIPNRGYSFAFHEGRLTHHAHNYENTSTLSEWEFAGLIEETRDDAFIIDMKNRLQIGDVLEFVPYTNAKPMLLRIYELEDIRDRSPIRADGGKVNVNAMPLLRIPFAWFHEEDIAKFKEQFPPFTVVRKEKALTQAAWARLALDKAAQQAELGDKNEDNYQEKRENLVELQAIENKDRTFRTPRSGVNGCCGRGCNGCLPFWHDEKYAKARALLKQKQAGEMLTAQEAKVSV